jgi:hypothetical protein
MYQLPHRSLATSGSPNASDTDATKSASNCIDERRLRVDNAERFREFSVEEMERDCVGKMRSD